MNGRPSRISAPTWPFGPIALFALLTAPLLLVIALFGQSEATEFNGYLWLLVFGPFIAALLDAWLDYRESPAVWANAARRIVQAAAALLFVLAIGGAVRLGTGAHILKPLLIVLLLGFLALALLILTGRLPTVIEDGLAHLDSGTVPWLLAALLAFCALFPPLSAFWSWFNEGPLFGVLLILAWPITFLLTGLPRLHTKAPARVLLALTIIFACLLFDDGLFRAYDHYMAYVGPALHALNGGVPMVDVYSQYGLLPWIVLPAAFHWLPETFGAAAVVVRLTTIAWFIVFLLTVYRLVECKSAGLLLAAIGLVWAIVFPEQTFNLNGLPSTQGYRYLVPSLTVLWIAWAGRSQALGSGIAIIAAIASLYSIEAVAFATGPALALATLQTIAARRLGPLMIMSISVLGGMAIGQAALFGYLYEVYGATPDYTPYFQLIAGFMPGEVSHWAVLIDPSFGLWVPVAAAFFIPLTLAGRDALAGRNSHTRAWSLVPVAVLGIGEASYFVGRSSTTTLGLVLLPLLVVALVGMDALLERWRANGAPALRWERIVVALTIAVVFAFSVERFARPYDPSKGNSTILRHCIAEGDCTPGTVIARLKANIEERPLDIDPKDPKHYEIARTDAVARLHELDRLLAADFFKPGRIMALIDPKRIPYLGVLLFTGRPYWYAGPVSSPLNDMNSPAIVRRIVATAASLAPGNRLLVDHHPAELLSLWQQVLTEAKARCRLARIDGGAFYDVLEVRSCSPA